MRDRRRGLTARQLRLIELVAHGQPNKEIASALGVSEQAVKEQISSLLLRLGVPNRAALAELGTRAAIVGAPVASADWLPFLFRDAPMSIAFLRGPEHVFEALNKEGLRAAGGRDLLGQPFRAAFPDASPEILSLIDEAYRELRAQTLTAVRNRWDRRGTGTAEDGFVDVVAQPVASPEGSVGGVLLYAIDVTDAERARRSLEQLAAEQFAVLDLIPSGVIVIDLSTRTVRTNDAGRRLTGGRAAATLSEAAAAPFRVRDRDGRELPYEELPLVRALSGAIVPTREYVFSSQTTGRDVRVRASAVPLYEPGGRVRAAVAIFTEVDAAAMS